MVRFRDLNKKQPGGSAPSAATGAGAGPAEEPVSTEGAIGAAPADPSSIYEDATFYLSKVFDAVKEQKQFALDPGFRIVRQVVESQAPGDALFVQTIQVDDWRNFQINKSINVSIYAVRLAHQLGYSGEKQVEIGMAGLLHEVGMCRVPDSIIAKKEQLTPQEFKIIQQHSEFGYQILEAYGEAHPYLAEAALQIHERIDGSGYPKGLKGDEIHDYAQIIGLVDIYEALTHSRPQRDRYNHFFAIKEIIKACKTQFQKKHLKALLNAFSIFPLSTYVRLNSNAVGRVIETYPEQPMRPKLQITFDSQGRKVLTDRIVNLPENALLYIVDSVNDDEIEQLERGHPFQGAPEPLGERDFSPPAQPVPPSKDAPPTSDAPPSRASAAKTGRSGKRPLMGLLVLVLLFAGISAWQGRLPAARSSADRGAPERILRQEAPGPAQTSRVQGDDERKGAVSAEDAAGRFRIETGPNTAAPSSSTEPRKPEASAPAARIPETAAVLMEREMSEAPAGSPNSDDRTPAGDAAQSLRKAGNPQRVEPLRRVDFRQPSAGGGQSPLESGANRSGRRPYSLLLSSFRSEALTRRAISIYRGQGISPYFVRVDLGDDGLWYRLFCGQYATFTEAEAAARTLAVEGAMVKKTRYANLIASDLPNKEAGAILVDLTDRGISPYAVRNHRGNLDLFVGAFYTEKGAENHRAELLAQGVNTRVVER